jgi:hypothetical protein
MTPLQAVRVVLPLVLLCAVKGNLGQQAFAQTACSTEKVNGDCKIVIDRSYPITLPVIQLRSGKKVTVEVINPLPFETLSLDPQSAQLVSGTDQIANFFTTASPNLKAIVAVTDQRTSRGGFNLLPLSINPDDPDNVKKVKADLIDLSNRLKTAQANLSAQGTRLRDFSSHATLVYLQIQEILSSIPRPAGTGTLEALRDPTLASTPSPWSNYGQWRMFLLCELAATCDGVQPNPAFAGLLQEANNLLTLVTPTSSGAPSKFVPGINEPILDGSAFTDKAIDTAKDINQLPTDQQSEYRQRLKALVENQMELSTDLSIYSSAISPIAKDLQSYFINIKQTEALVSRTTTVSLGRIYDPQDVSNGTSAGGKLFGRQVVYSINAVNNVSVPPAAVPATAQKKSINSITVLYADPIFEVSAGVFFSTLPNRSFANQTIVTQNPGGVPTQGNVVIAETISRPTVEPFVAGNWRLGHDFVWPGRRRGAVYFTAALGINTNSATTADVAFGPSISWRSMMISPLYHLGRDTRLTQGEFVGEVWCNASGANGSIPKCSGNPPSPTTQRYWTSAFAIGISVRVPSVFK